MTDPRLNLNDWCYFGTELQQSRDPCLEATSSHLLSINSTKKQELSQVYSSNSLLCFCVSRGMLLNQVQRLISVLAVWRMWTAARRIYQPLQVRHTETGTRRLYLFTEHTCCILYPAWIMKTVKDWTELSSGLSKLLLNTLAKVAPSVFAYVTVWISPPWAPSYQRRFLSVLCFLQNTCNRLWNKAGEAQGI